MHIPWVASHLHPSLQGCSAAQCSPTCLCSVGQVPTTSPIADPTGLGAHHLVKTHQQQSTSHRKRSQTPSHVQPLCHTCKRSTNWSQAEWLDSQLLLLDKPSAAQPPGSCETLTNSALTLPQHLQVHYGRCTKGRPAVVDLHLPVTTECARRMTSSSSCSTGPSSSGGVLTASSSCCTARRTAAACSCSCSAATGGTGAVSSLPRIPAAAPAGAVAAPGADAAPC